MCKSCNTSLTYHQNTSSLKCHLCGFKDMNVENKKYNTEFNLFLPKEIENIEIVDNILRKEIKKNISKLNKFIDINQRIFNEEIYLFDHPNFGVLVSVSRI